MFLKVVQVVIVLLAFHYHVIHVYFNISSNLLSKHLIHESLIRRPCVLQSKQHDLIAKEALAYDKRSLLLVRFVKLNLQEWIAILRAGFVQVSEVLTHSPLAVCFFDHYHVNQPLWVVYFSYEIYFQQLANFFSHGFISFLGEDSFLLPHKREEWRDIKLMNHGT